MSQLASIQGVVHAIGETQNVSDTFKKRELVICTNPGDKYLNYAKVELTQDATVLADALNVNQPVRIHYEVQGREYTRKSDGNKDVWVSLRVHGIDDLTQPMQTDRHGEQIPF